MSEVASGRSPADAGGLDLNLISLSQKVANEMPSQEIRARLLGHFVAAGRRVLADSEVSNEIKRQKLSALFDVYSQISQSPRILFWAGRDGSSDLSLHQARSGLLPASSLPEAIRLGAVVSFMRFVSNQIATGLLELRADLSANPLPTELRDLRSVIRAYQPIPGRIAAYSFRLREVDPILKDFAAIRRSEAWLELLRLSRTIYVPWGRSGDIEGMQRESENVLMLKLGPEILNLLFESFSNRRPASTQTAVVMEPFPVVDLVLVADQNHSGQSSPSRRPAAVAPNRLVLIGKIPGEYLGLDKNTSQLGYLEIANRKIVAMAALRENEVRDFSSAHRAGAQVIELKSSRGTGYDVLYPGLIELHNHTKQNVLPVWRQALGQFENRFEWREWNDYKKSVSQNMNPWIGFDRVMECASFRWSELQAMVVGTTYLQGPSSCVSGFAIQRVEDKDSFVSKRRAVQAPTDIVTPDEFQFLWQTLRPIIQSGKTYEQALAQVVVENCPVLRSKIRADNVNRPDGLKILSDGEMLRQSCPDTAQKPLPPKFIRFVYWIHPNVAAKKNYLLDVDNSAAVISHLAEGRRSDPYNKREYELIRLLGLNRPGLVLVHGVGIGREWMSELAANGIGLVWSPFSNLILYGETLDIKSAHQAGVRIALGADWLPTGTKGPLEEVKVAARYVDQDVANEGLRAIFTDEVLYRMITENPARMIRHWEIGPEEAGVGRLAVGAMGSVIVARERHPNPHTNLVRHVTEKDIGLVVVDGRPLYGNREYLEPLSLPLEPIGQLDTVVRQAVPKVPSYPYDGDETAKSLHFQQIVAAAQDMTIPVDVRCEFEQQKVLVAQESGEPVVQTLKAQSGLNLDRFLDIQKLLAVNVLTQSFNRSSRDGDPGFATSYLHSLYSCNDPDHLARVEGLIRPAGEDDWRKSIRARESNRKDLGSVSRRMAESYK